MNSRPRHNRPPSPRPRPAAAAAAAVPPDAVHFDGAVYVDMLLLHAAICGASGIQPDESGLTKALTRLQDRSEGACSAPFAWHSTGGLRWGDPRTVTLFGIVRPDGTREILAVGRHRQSGQKKGKPIVYELKHWRHESIVRHGVTTVTL